MSFSIKWFCYIKYITAKVIIAVVYISIVVVLILSYDLHKLNADNIIIER